MKDRTKRRKFNKNYRKTFMLGKMSAGFVFIGIFFVLCLLYLSQSNKIALRGYDISSLENERKELLAERERLEIESSRLQSVQEIETGLKDANMVSVKKINYIPASTNIAMNRQNYAKIDNNLYNFALGYVDFSGKSADKSDKKS